MDAEMGDPLVAILRSCCVMLNRGTGVFVARNHVLTCAHVIGDARTTVWEGEVESAQGFTCRGRLTHCYHDNDLALIQTERESEATIMLGCAEEELVDQERLLVLGYPSYEQGKRELGSIFVEFDGLANAGGIPRLQFKGNNVVGGFSGSPVLNLHTGRVVGLVMETRGKNTPLGGWSVPAETIAERLKEAQIPLQPTAAIARQWYQALELRNDRVTFSATSLQPRLRREQLDSPNLFYYGSRKIAFRGRENEMRELESFLTGDAQFAWCLLTGPGGAGKSRLALELCLTQEVDWRAGFLDKSLLADRTFWLTWRPNRPTLLVVDYASAYAEQVGDLVRDLSRKRSVPNFPIRLLLIDRDANEWYGRFLGKGNSEREAALACQYPRRNATPLCLGSLADDDLLAVVQSVNPNKFLHEKKDALLERLRKLDPERSVLFAAMLAATNHGRNDRISLMREILRREKDVRWRPAGANDFDEALVAFASLCGGVSISRLQEQARWLERAVQQFSRPRFETITGRAPTTEMLAPLEPDLLGEAHVLDWVNTLGDSQVKEVVNCAWTLNPEGTFLFMRRVVPDFPEHEALPRLLQPPDSTVKVHEAWSSFVVDILLDIPIRYLKLGLALFEGVKSIVATHPTESDLFENFARGANNLINTIRRARYFDRAKELREYLDTRLDSHPDAVRGRDMQARLLAGDLIFLGELVDEELARPLEPAPLTFLGTRAILRQADEVYSRLVRLCSDRRNEPRLHEWYAAGAFHLLLASLKPVFVKERIQLPAVVLLEQDFRMALERGEQIFRALNSFLPKDLSDPQVRAFLARSASALCCGYASLNEPAKAVLITAMISKLAAEHTGEAELRGELARAQYNLVWVFQKVNKARQARRYFAQLSTLADRYPEEPLLAEKRSKAAKLLL